MPVSEDQPEWLKSIFNRKLAQKRQVLDSKAFQAKIIERSQSLHDRMSELWYSTQNGGFERILTDQNDEVKIEVRITINDDASISMFVDTESITIWPSSQDKTPQLLVIDPESGQLRDTEFDFTRIDQTVQLLDHLESL